MSVAKASAGALVPVAPLLPDRFALLDWLLPACEPDRAALLYPKSRGSLSPGWVMNQADAERAVEAYRNGALAGEVFDSTTQDGKAYRITGAVRLGLVPHRDRRVVIFCVDLDDHGEGATVHLAGEVNRFFGAEPLTFTSKGGKGLHRFFRLAQSMETTAFVKWAKAWGFNRRADIEIFPKTVKNTQAWLPNAPNEQGGDAYVSGDFESCIVTSLPEAPTARLTTTTLHFLRGFVSKPGRNAALNAAAYELGQKRVARNEAWALCQRGAQLCGLEHEEPQQTYTTFQSGYDAGTQVAPALSNQIVTSGAASEQITLRRLDGIGNGERFIDHYGRDVRYSYGLDRWLVWTGQRWSLDSQATVEAMAKQTARLILQEKDHAIKEAREAGKDDADIEVIEKAFLKHYLAAARVHGVKDTLTMAQSEQGVKIAISEIDANPMLLNVLNGTIDLATGTLRHHDPRDCITKLAPVSFDPDADSSLWQSFLDRIFDGDEELIAYIQRAVGYSLTGGVGEQCLFFLYGSGQNGKSVFIQTLLHMLGEYAQKAPTEMIMKQERSSSGGASPDMARLRGVRLAVTAELEENQRMGEARVKDLTGADRIVARHLYREPIEYDPTHKLWIYGNHKPTIRGTDEGIWRRIRLIPFTVRIPDHEKDPQLTEKLQREGAGVLAWALRGCLEWQRDGLGLPRAVARATEAYRSESDRLGEFIDECCVQQVHASVGKSDLYTAYEAWCKQSGEYAVSKKKLGLRLTERGFEEQRTKHYRAWLGLKLIREGASHVEG